MSNEGRVIDAPSRGERLVILQSAEATDGRLMQYDQFLQPGCGFQTEHIHLDQDEHYEVRAGSAVYSVNGVEKTAKAGEFVTILAGNNHIDLWNRDGAVELYIRREFVPSLGIEVFIETWLGCVRDNKHITRELELNLIQQAVTANVIRTETYLVGTPIPLQRILVPLGAFVGWLMGYKPYYPEYTQIPPYIPPRRRRRPF